MRVIHVYVSVPEGYSLCPFPKVRDADRTEKISFNLDPSQARLSLKDRIDLVLNLLNQTEMVGQWKTNHASFKGTTDYLLGVEGDKIEFSPIQTNDWKENGSLRATIRWLDVRLYYKHPFPPTGR